ncbi:hypothetical protein FLONG3_7225 [Fusarium longipes]|uniref:Transposase Tc1-like domain-containing protein n=1 Tax=Fusarium longipes TaxID=694270 RepID=A0A395SG64_9HYPO|nr:hypothetical protein FLONG3_7225 [Fusarium longipes]
MAYRINSTSIASAQSPPTPPVSPKDPLFFTSLIDKQFGLNKANNGPMDEQQAWAMRYNKQLASEQLMSSQQQYQLDAFQDIVSDHHAKPSDPQLLRNVDQAQQLLWATSLPTGAQVFGAEFLHAQGFSKEAVAKQIQYQLPGQAATAAATRLSVRARARAKARAKVTPSSSTFTLSIRPPNPKTLNNDQLHQLVEFIQSSPHARRMPIAKIPAALGFDCSERTITLALGRKGFKFSPAMTRPRIDEETRQLRLNFAHQHLHWTVEQWASVLFYAEMRVPLTEEPQEVFVTRKSDEDVHPDCINIDPVAPADLTDSNVYFAYLSGVAGTGQLRSWTRHNNRERGPLGPMNWYINIFPSLATFYQSHPVGSRFALSPNLPAHSSTTIKEALRGGYNPVVHLPPASPDLNPISRIFETIKTNLKADKANSLFGDVAEYRIDDVVRDTWESISQEYVNELVASMHERCQAIIDADGWYTRF